MSENSDDVDPVENFNLQDPFFSALRKMYLVSRDVAGHLDTWEDWYIQQLEKDIRALKEKYGEEMDGESYGGNGNSGVYNFDIADEYQKILLNTIFSLAFYKNGFKNVLVYDTPLAM